MKNKILSLALILMLVSAMFILTGCGESSDEGNDNDNIVSNAEVEETESANEEICGEWKLNVNINSSKERKYDSLRTIFGDSLNSSSNTLVLNEDGTFELAIGAYYLSSGNYSIEDNIISFYNVVDDNRNDDLEIEENLKVEIIEYNENTLLQMKLFEIEDAEVYIYFGRSEDSGYDKHEVPEMTFEDEEYLEIDGYKLDFGTYVGYFTTTQTESLDDAYEAEVRIKLNSDGTISIYNGDLEEEWTERIYTIIDDNKLSCGNGHVYEVIDDNTLKFNEVEMNYVENDEIE